MSENKVDAAAARGAYRDWFWTRDIPTITDRSFVRRQQAEEMAARFTRVLEELSAMGVNTSMMTPGQRFGPTPTLPRRRR